jgi:hypothetical protein
LLPKPAQSELVVMVLVGQLALELGDVEAIGLVNQVVIQQ